MGGGHFQGRLQGLGPFPLKSKLLKLGQIESEFEAFYVTGSGVE